MSHNEIQDRMETMTLAQKVGQVMLIGLDPTATSAPYTAMTPPMADLIAELHVGGLVLFERNVGRPDELAALTAAAQEAATRAGSPPLIVSIDQEGGRVVRMRQRRGYTEVPSAMALGATGDPEAAREAASILARELLAVGVNMDLAPDLDVNSNPKNPIIGTRSFGSDPQMVARFGVAFLEGLQSTGVMAVGKHFPGHGDTGLDSHFALPTVPHDRNRLERIEFAPFRAAMAAGVAGIMSAHVTFPAVDPTPGLPGTLSPRVMTDLLRMEMGYEGLLLTDSLDMGALEVSGYPVPSAAVAALAAGVDMLCISHGFDVHRRAHAALMEAVERGEIPMSRLDAAVDRVLTAKARFGLIDRAPSQQVDAGATVGSESSRAAARRIAASAITLVKDEGELLPIPPGARPLIVELSGSFNPASGVVAPMVAEPLAAALGGDALVLSVDPGESDVRQTLDRARGRMVIVATADVSKHPGQALLVRVLHEAGVKLVVVAVGGPYDLMAFPHVGTYLAAYGANPPTVDALAEVLAGRAKPQGQLPVVF